MTQKEVSFVKQKNYNAYLTNILPCIGYGILTGVLTGGTIFLFKFLAGKAEHFSRFLYQEAKNSIWTILLVFAVLIGLAYLMSLLHKAVPECKGGGIPRSEGILRGVLSFRWAKTLLATFFGSMISFFAGLPCGSEGPAVLIGTSIGCMSGKASRKQIAWNRYVMTGGAGAGFAVATGAPLSGILFALEEIHKRFSPMLVLTVSMAVLSATGTNHLLCNAFHMNPALFTLENLPAFELSHAGYLILLGILISIAVAIFDGSILLFRRFTGRGKKGPVPVKLMVTFVLAGILCLFLADGTYSGHHMIVHILEHNTGTLLLLALFIIRLVMMLLVTDSGATGGIFIPTLAIGVLAAALSNKLLLLLGMPAELSTLMIFLGMCAFIGGTLRAPLTASVLFVELSGQFTGLFYVALVVFIVSLITELFNQTPFYDKALEEMTEAYHHGKEMKISRFTLIVSPNDFAIGKAVRDIMWPHASVIESISHADSDVLEEMDDGEQRLYEGDRVTIRAAYYGEKEILDILKGIAGDDVIIESK